MKNAVVIHNEEEISGIKKAGQAAGFVREELKNFILPGMSTKEVDEIQPTKEFPFYWVKEDLTEEWLDNNCECKVISSSPGAKEPYALDYCVKYKCGEYTLEVVIR